MPNSDRTKMYSLGGIPPALGLISRLQRARHSLFTFQPMKGMTLEMNGSSMLRTGVRLLLVTTSTVLALLLLT